MEFITIEEAVKSNDRVIGLAFVIMVVIVILAIAYVEFKEQKQKRNRDNLVKSIEKQVREQVEKEHHDKDMERFKEWMETRIELRNVKRKLADVENCFIALQQDYNNLARDAENCPAYGTMSKRGFDK